MADSASISVSANDQFPASLYFAQVMSFMAGKTSRRNYGKVRSAIASVAQERMQILLGQAKDVAGKDQKLSRRYVELARKISTRTKIRIPKEDKRYLCKGCGIALIPGLNARVRLRPRNTRVVITCLSCGAVKRYPFNRKNVGEMGRPR